jgi:SNF2 family DNA or RNA helicase
VRLAPWRVTALALDVGAAVELLCSCAGKEILAPGLVIGSDLAWWTSAMRFAAAVVARQQFVPGLEDGAHATRALWKPALPPADGARLAALAEAMPGVARAFTTGVASAPEEPAHSLLSAFVGAVVDHLVRGSSEVIPEPSPASRRKKARRFDSAHDAWLHALRSPDAEVHAAPEELAGLRDQVEAWQRPLAVASRSAFRLCFRLEEPEADAGNGSVAGAEGWYVRYLLQDVRDPSLLVPAGDAWRAKGRHAAALAREHFDAREYLLTALGQAAGLCGGIERSLRSAAPAGYELDGSGAHEFLDQHAAVLEQAGFGVLLPAWWTRKGTKLRLVAKASVKSPAPQSGAGLSLSEVVEFDWEVALGDDTLTRAELEALAKLKSPLVKVRGQWVQMTGEEIEAALRFWREKQKGTATVRELVLTALGARRDSGVLPLAAVRATGWVGDLLAQLEGKAGLEELSSPDRFRGSLRPYQQRGYSWLAFLARFGLGACLADDMGLGKTVQALAFVQRRWESDGRRPALLVCPTSVVGNWQKEAERFTPDLPVLVHHGVERKKGGSFAQQASRHALVVSSYSLLHRDEDLLRQVSWSGVILDEAQNIKNPGTRQSRAARSLDAGYRIALTGTPVENSVGDLWSIMEFLNPGLLGTQADFRRRFFLPIQAGRDPAAAAALRKLTGPFVLRRLKTDRSIIADLPEKMEMKVFCTLTREQASLYAAVVADAESSLQKADGIGRKGVVLATLSKLKQVCNHPAQFLGDNSSIPGRSGKLARLTEMLQEILEMGEQTLVFSQFSEMGTILRRHLEETFGREVLFLHGAVPKRRRDLMVERFQAGDGPRVFVLSLKAGGTGLNLTRASHVFHFDRWWNPAVENQATDRAFRIGQTRNVQVHKFLCAGTLEAKIDAMIERKKEVADEVVGTGEGWLTELSTSELSSLFALSRDAIGD